MADPPFSASILQQDSGLRKACKKTYKLLPGLQLAHGTLVLQVSPVPLTGGTLIMSKPKHLQTMSHILYAVAGHQGKVEYAAQIADKVGCSIHEVSNYVAALRNAGYLEGSLIEPGTGLFERRHTSSGIRLTVAGFSHVDQHRQSLKPLSPPSKTLGE